ncbi:MAG: glycosyltransferase family 4 protein [Rhizomicrobium sp.]
MESTFLNSKRPLRIVFQSNAFLPDVIGGIEVLAAHFLPRLMARGHQVLVITSSVGGQPQGRTSYNGIDILKLNFVEALMDRQIATTLRLGHEVDRAIAEFAPDVLHINDTNTPSFFFLRQRAIKNLPRTLTLHSPIRQAGSDGLQTRLVREADCVVAVSNAVGADAIAHTPAIREKLIVIPNALPMPALEPTALPFEPPVLLCLGRVVADKGFDVAVRAFALARQRHTSAQLVISGNGIERLRLEEMVRELDIGQYVHFTKWVEPEAVAEAIAEATAVLMPSRWPEPFGLVALQAAQMARPVIASRVGGLPEVIEDRQTGILVPPDDPSALADAIALLLSDAAAAREMGRRARERAMSVFDFDALVEAYETAYWRTLQIAGQTPH